VGREAWGVGREKTGQQSVKPQGWELAVIEKRQNKANWNRTLITCHQGIKVDTIGVIYAKQTQFRVV
jgi:hypothetical protein